MSANDHELDYIHVPHGPVDKAITELEEAMAKWTYYGPVSDTRQVFELTIKALRELNRAKRERW